MKKQKINILKHSTSTSKLYSTTWLVSKCTWKLKNSFTVSQLFWHHGGSCSVLCALWSFTCLSATNHKWFVASLSGDTVTPVWSNVLRSSGHLSSPPSHRLSSPAHTSHSSPLPCRPSVMPPENHLVLQSAMSERWRPLPPESPAAWQSSLTFNGVHPADSSDRTDPSCNSYFLQEVLKIRDFHMLQEVG